MAEGRGHDAPGAMPVEQRPEPPASAPRSSFARETLIYGLGVVLTRTPAPRLQDIRRHRPYPEPDLVPRRGALPGPQGPRLAAAPVTPDPGPQLAAPAAPAEPSEPEPATVSMPDVNGRSGSPGPHGDNGSAASEHAADGVARPSPTPRGSG